MWKLTEATILWIIYLLKIRLVIKIK